MKPSPLRLEWVSYPRLSYEARSLDTKPSPISTIVKARVIFNDDGEHGAELHLENATEDATTFAFAVDVVASFSFDFELAIQTYKCNPLRLPGIVAANISRVLYSGARELLATATGRAPNGPAMIDSVLIEPTDVEIASKEPMTTILRQVFRVDEDTLARIEAESSTDATTEHPGAAKKKPARRRKPG